MLPYHNTQLKHWNPGAENPLILPVHVICNTSDDQIHENIRANSRDRGDWLKAAPAHFGVAVLCGSGPSLADSLEDIRSWRSFGGAIFAMNGAAKFLADHGIEADYQVIIDARPETAALVGPAKAHLFASQVSPECFKAAPDARLWHLQIENIDDLLPEYEDDFCMIGGAASVGNTATCLAYAMGFRNLHIYGYDSCHRDGNGHAFHQKLNDGDPCAWVDFAGKTYLASLTMKLQAEKFQDTALALKQLGCQITVHGTGLLPDMFNVPRQISEEEKYERMWLHSDYRAFAPGEQAADTFLNVIEGKGRVIDFGCGTGRGAMKINAAGHEVLLVDFAGNCRDREAMVLPFRKHDLTQPLDERAEYGYCTDVMEHIPPEHVDDVLRNIFACCGNVFFQISLVDDVCGAYIGHPLHLSIHPAEWWTQKLEQFGRIYWFAKYPQTAMFYVTKEHK